MQDRLRLFQALLAAVLVLAWLVAAGCNQPTATDRAWLRQLEHQAIITDPPEGFVAEGAPIGDAGTPDYRGVRQGSKVVMSFTYTVSELDGVNAWAERMKADGWTLQSIRCPGSVFGLKELDGFTARGSVDFTSELASVHLEAPPSDANTTVSLVPEPELCPTTPGDSRPAGVAGP